MCSMGIPDDESCRRSQMRATKMATGFGAMMLAIGVGLAGSVGALVAMKQVSNAQYAKTLCATFNRLSGASAPAPDASTNETLQAGYVANADAFIAKINDGRTQLAKITPKSGGRKVAVVFDRYFRDYAAAIQELRDAFAAADPTNVAFQGDVTRFTVGLSVLGAKLGDPFSKVRDSSLLAAFQKVPSCKGVVTITGS
jgi:hypothetical protein